MLGTTEVETLKRSEDHEIEVQSYRYLRVAMIALLTFLAIAVFDQTKEQDKYLVLASISAYYYTPAQAVFVGALIALGVCMIALQGTTKAEDILLNIVGMLAPVVALVPTGRSSDTTSALRACQESPESFTHQGMPLDCSLENLQAARRALDAAARTSIENNVTALLYTGAVALVAAGVLLYVAGLLKKLLPYFVAATLVYLVGLLSFWVFRDIFVEWAHHVAAWGLFTCIFLVAIVNALRYRKQHLNVQPAGSRTVSRRFSLQALNPYAIVAGAMLAAALISAAAAILGPWSVTLFWLETVLIALFAALWIIQTVERWTASEHTPNDLLQETPPGRLGAPPPPGPNAARRPAGRPPGGVLEESSNADSL